MLRVRIGEEGAISSPPPKKKLQFITFINVLPLIIPNIKVQCKQIFVDIPPKKLLNLCLDYNTVLRLQIFLEILDNY